MTFHKEKLLSCMYIYQKVSKNHPVIKLWYIWNKIASLDLNLHQFAWNAVRLFFHMLNKHMLKWNTLWPYSWAFLLGSQNRQKFRHKNADIKWVASELVEVVCYTSVSLKGIHGTRRNILSFSFVVLCFLVVQWNVIGWIWKISIMIKFSDDHVFSFFPLFLLWMICQCGFSFYILCLFLCFNAMILLCFLEILMWNSLHYTHMETHAAFGVLVRALPCDSGCCCLQWPLLIII